MHFNRPCSHQSKSVLFSVCFDCRSRLVSIDDFPNNLSIRLSVSFRTVSLKSPREKRVIVQALSSSLSIQSYTSQVLPTLASIINCSCLILYSLQKHTYQAKLFLFKLPIDNHVKKLQFYFFLLMKRNPLPLAYFRKMSEILSTVQTAQSAQKQQKHQIHFSVYTTWDV